MVVAIHVIDLLIQLMQKTIMFYSKYWTPGTSGVDAFAFNWGGHNNWLVPPIKLVNKVILHMLK